MLEDRNMNNLFLTAKCSNANFPLAFMIYCYPIGVVVHSFLSPSLSPWGKVLLVFFLLRERETDTPTRKEDGEITWLLKFSTDRWSELFSLKYNSTKNKSYWSVWTASVFFFSVGKVGKRAPWWVQENLAARLMFDLNRDAILLAKQWLSPASQLCQCLVKTLLIGIKLGNELILK